MVRPARAPSELDITAGFDTLAFVAEKETTTP